MNDSAIIGYSFETARHRTTWIEAGPEQGPLIVFLHGWPELGLIWRRQIEHFAARGWRCIAPDMRGYGGSSRPDSTSAYAIREIVTDMLELHDALGATPAVWIGHDWGSAVAWSMASHHPERCRGVGNICVPYLAQGFVLGNLLPLVDRSLYPEERFPAGQWDYWLYYREHFTRAARVFEADVVATLAAVYQAAPVRESAATAFTADIRAQGGWFGGGERPLSASLDSVLLRKQDFEAFVAAFSVTGFSGANAWYMNDVANRAFAAEAVNFGRISIPALFIHATRDTVCDTTQSKLAESMREDCLHLTEVTIEGGHELMLERPDTLNAAIANWLAPEALC